MKLCVKLCTKLCGSSVRSCVKALWKLCVKLCVKALYEALHEALRMEAPYEALYTKALRTEALYEALYTKALRTTALLRRLYIKALCRASCRALWISAKFYQILQNSVLFCLVGVEKLCTGHFYPYRLWYFMHFLLDKGYFMLAYSHYPKPHCAGVSARDLSIWAVVWCQRRGCILRSKALPSCVWVAGLLAWQ